MSYYKSENPNEQISEAIQNLRKEIAKEYSRRENGNPEYRANREQLSTKKIDYISRFFSCLIWYQCKQLN